MGRFFIWRKRGKGSREILILPPYSPDLYPIEPMIAKVKTALRSAKTRTSGALEQALSAAMRTVTAADARGYFMHYGYR